MESIPELEKPEKFGDREIIKKADAIIYQILPAGMDNRYNYNFPFEIGLGDPKDRSRFKTHFLIKNEVEKNLETSIEERVGGLVFIEKEADINLVIDPEWYFLIKKLHEKDKKGIKALNYFQNMLERYGIKKLWIQKEEENVSDILNKLVWDIQTSGYAEKEGLSNVEFLRWRLTGELPKKENEKDKKDKEE